MAAARGWSRRCCAAEALAPLARGGAAEPLRGGLETLDRKQVLFVLQTASRAGVADHSVWKAYAARALAEVPSCSPEELCELIRALARAGYSKRDLLNKATRRLRAGAASLEPRLLAQVISDLRRLGHLDGPLMASLADGAMARLPLFRTFDLPLLLTAFAKSALRDTARVAKVGQALLEEQRRAEMTPSVVAGSFYALALLDIGEDGTAEGLARVVIPRCVTEASPQELANLAFALVLLDLPAAELLSFVLERLARRCAELDPRSAHSLGIVRSCVALPEALRPAMRADLEADSAARARCAAAMERIGRATEDVEAAPVVSSKMHRSLDRFLDRLELPRKAEQAVGPYVLDYELPGRIAVEVDGHKHFYAFSRRLTAKSELKLRVLRAMGYKTVSVPHFEWLRRPQDAKLRYLAAQIEEAAGTPLSAVIKAAAQEPAPAEPRRKRPGSKHVFPPTAAPQRGARR